MPMPTTRRGRYLLYRKRAKNRWLRAWKKRARSNPLRRRITTRSWIINVYGKMLPYDGDPPAAHPAGSIDWHEHEGDVKPGRGRWGVKVDPFPPGEAPGTRYHARTALLDYVFRRVRRLPKLRHVARGPYLLPREAVPPSLLYPHEFYPSGQRSYYWRTYVD